MKMEDEEIIREALAFIEEYKKMLGNATVAYRYKAFRDFLPKITAILKDEVF